MRALGLVTILCLGLAVGTLSPALPPPTATRALTGAAILVERDQPEEPRSDPFPIRRIFLGDMGLSLTSFPVNSGAITRLSQQEFEDQVQAASRALSPRIPQLLESRYQASWSPEGLVGTGEWNFHGEGYFSVEPLSVALSNLRDPESEPGRLFRGEPNNRLLGNWLDVSRSDQAWTFNWSARATQDTSEERYVLKLPASPIATLELELPQGWLPQVTEPAVLTGSVVTTDPSRVVWLIRFGQQNQLEFSLKSRRPRNSLQPPLRLARQSRYTVQPDQIAFTVEFNPTAAQDDLSPFLIQCDQAANWTEVKLPPNWQWQVDPSTPPNLAQLRIVPTSSGAVGPMLISGYVRVPDSRSWTLPQIRLPDGWIGTDDITVRLDADLQLLTHDPGDYRLTGLANERGSRLTYTAQLLANTNNRLDRRAPSLRVRRAEASWETIEEIRWRPLPEPSELSVNWRGRVSRGPLSLIRIQNPVGFQVSSVSSVPNDPNLTWTQAGATLTVEPSRSYSTGEPLELRVDYRPTLQMKSSKSFNSSAGSSYPFPRLALLGNGRREGRLEIVIPPEHRSWSQQQPTLVQSGSWIYQYLGSAPAGELTLTPLPNNPISLEAELTSVSGQLQCISQLRFPDLGDEALYLYAPTPPSTRWSVQSNLGQMQSVFGEGLTSSTLLGISSGWSAVPLAVTGLLTPGELWQLRIPRGFATPIEITATATTRTDGPALVPVPLGSQSVLPQFRSANNASLPQRGSLGVYPIQHSSDAESDRYQLQLDDLLLMNQVQSDGRVSVRFMGRIVRSPGRPWTVELPPTAELESITIGGQIVEQFTTEPGTRLLRIPLPQSQNPTQLAFEIGYTLPSRSTGWGQAIRVQSPLPRSPQFGEIRSRWQLSPDWVFWPSLELAYEGPNLTDSLVLIASKPLYAAHAVLCALLFGGAIGSIATDRGRRWTLFIALIFCGGSLLLMQLGSSGWAALLRPLLAISLLSLILSSLRWDRGLTTVWLLAPGFLLSWGTSQAQAPELAVVYITADRTVYAPNSVLKRLEELSRPIQPPVLLTEAEFRGELLAGYVQFEATWQLTLASGAPLDWQLPLQGVRLQELLLDEVPLSIGETSPAGYQVRLTGRGTHELKARFAVLVTNTNALTQVQFQTAECPQSRVTIRLPAAVQDATVESRAGRQERQSKGEQLLLEADQGVGRTVLIRWKTPTPLVPANVSVRQLAVWDLSESSAQATFALQFQIEGAPLDQIVLGIPADYQCDRPIVRNQDGRTVTLKSLTWSPIPDQRLLQLVPSEPLEGSVILSMRVYLTSVLTDRPVLRLLEVPNAQSGDSDLAIRTTGVVIDELPRLAGVIDYSPDSVIRIPRLGTLPELGLETRGVERVLHQVNAASMEARPVLRSMADNRSLECETTWTIANFSQARGLIRGTAPVPVSVVDLHCPSTLNLDSLQSPELLHWSREGNRVQAWFAKPQRALELTWTGHLANQSLATRGEDSTKLELPVVHPLGRPEQISLSVIPAVGWLVSAEQNPGWELLASRSDPTKWEFVGSRTASAPRFTITSPTAVLVPELLERIEPQGEDLLYSAKVNLELQGSQGHHWEFTLTGLGKDAQPELFVPPGVTVTNLDSSSDQRRWRLLLPENQPAAVPIRWSVRLAREAQTPEMVMNFGLPPVPWTSRQLTCLLANTTPVLGPDGWQLESPWNGQRSLWRSSGKPGRWQLLFSDTAKSAPVAEVGAAPVLPVVSNEAPAPMPLWPVLRVLGWLLGLAAWMGLTLFCRSSWWPERISLAGFLGFWALGFGTNLGTLFLVLGVLGLVLRLFMITKSVTFRLNPSQTEA